MDAISSPSQANLTSPNPAPPKSITVDRGELAALSALSDNPWHLPVDGLCLEQLLRKGLIEPAGGDPALGYALTQVGHHLLATEIIPPTIGRSGNQDRARVMAPLR